MNPKLKAKISESLSAVLPITGVMLALSIFLKVNIGTVVMFIVGAVMLILGMGMFQLGAETAMSQLGEGIGVELSKTKSIALAGVLAFVMGAVITMAEPDLQVLSNQVPSLPNMTIILTVALGVGIFLALAVLRIVLRINLSYLLMGLYAAVLLMSFFVPKEFLPVAFDSGGVTTGPITVPFIMAMGVGLSSVRGDKDASSDSFGLVALASIGPIAAVMLLGLFCGGSDTAYTAASVAKVETMWDVMREFTYTLPRYAGEVLISIIPIFAVFAIFQLISRRYQRRQRLRIIVGFVYTYIGLVLFLCGVNVGFAPVGSVFGGSVASSNYSWLLLPIGMLIGYFIVKAEPAIQILNRQVQSVTNGAISEKSMNRCLSVGVAVSVGLAMLRVLTGLEISWILIPGYIAALVMSVFVPKIFVGIAFDSGGVASGPMTSTFLLPLCIGAAEALGGNIMTNAFGVIALVALTPLIAVQIMGLRYKVKLKRLEKAGFGRIVLPEDIDDIVEFEEGWMCADGER